MQADTDAPTNEIYFDSHNHLLDYSSQQLPKQLQTAYQNSVCFACSNTTHQQEYQRQLEIVKLYSQNIMKIHYLEEFCHKAGKMMIIPSFGIHPCFIHHEKDNQTWEQSLQKVVNLNPFYCVGEIGLDFRTATLETNLKETQIHFFLKQFQMALRLNRTVTVHCVRAYGDILKHFKQYNKMIESQVKNEAKEEGVGYKYKGTPIIMHSYGGSKEITKSLLKLTNLNVYFSLSLKRSEQLCTVIPLDKLLLQTDAPYQSNVSLLLQQKLVAQDLESQKKQQVQKINRIQFVRANVTSLCKYYGLSRSQFARAVLSNALKAFRLLA